MSDYLVKLYKLQPVLTPPDIRRPIGPEYLALLDWVKNSFGTAWASECMAALSNCPPSIFICARGQFIGFCCYDATAKGFLGPIGVLQTYRGQNIGSHLLLAALNAMHREGYGYAIIGSIGPVEFFRKVCQAEEIKDSTPGIYQGAIF
jgi:ribosomal protein S18 acetylase RimI-like enzyme